jgi:hypothetical protein
MLRLGLDGYRVLGQVPAHKPLCLSLLVLATYAEGGLLGCMLGFGFGFVVTGGQHRSLGGTRKTYC